MDKVVDFATAKTKHDLAALNQKEEKLIASKRRLRNCQGIVEMFPARILSADCLT